MTGLGEFTRHYGYYRKAVSRPGSRAGTPPVYRVPTGISQFDLRVKPPLTERPTLRNAAGNDRQVNVFCSVQRKAPQHPAVGSGFGLLEQLRDARAAAGYVRHVASRPAERCSTGLSGVDVLSRERGWHPRCWRPYYAAAAQNGLQVAMHLGEDMDDLVTGLRLISSALDMFAELGVRKPRLGHALAIRVDVRAWYARRGRMAAHPWEQVLDLLWARKTLTSRRDRQWLESLFRGWHDTPAFRGCQVGTSMATFASRFVAKTPLCPTCGASQRRLRHEGLTHLARPSCMADTDGPFAQLGNRWFELVEALQLKVRNRVASEAIVEICPSSNAAVSGLGSSWALDQKGRGWLGKPALRCVYGSDDPGLLDTDIRIERALAGV